ncbi:hypothetical protein RI367_008011 [Sorochytrium milnesiophthora]
MASTAAKKELSSKITGMKFMQREQALQQDIKDNNNTTTTSTLPAHYLHWRTSALALGHLQKPQVAVEYSHSYLDFDDALESVGRQSFQSFNPDVEGTQGTRRADHPADATEQGPAVNSTEMAERYSRIHPNASRGGGGISANSSVAMDSDSARGAAAGKRKRKSKAEMKSGDSDGNSSPAKDEGFVRPPPFQPETTASGKEHHKQHQHPNRHKATSAAFNRLLGKDGQKSEQDSSSSSPPKKSKKK